MRIASSDAVLWQRRLAISPLRVLGQNGLFRNRSSQIQVKKDEIFLKLIEEDFAVVFNENTPGNLTASRDLLQEQFSFKKA